MDLRSWNPTFRNERERWGTRQKTDEVYYKKSDYLRDHQGATDPESE
jgi:hypothetical protein